VDLKLRRKKPYHHNCISLCGDLTMLPVHHNATFPPLALPEETVNSKEKQGKERVIFQKMVSKILLQLMVLKVSECIRYCFFNSISFLLSLSSELAEHIRHAPYTSYEGSLRQIFLSPKNVSYGRIQQWYPIFTHSFLRRKYNILL